ncbi:alpha/beta hydrolase [Aneurinibacillus aneurinilyticus]|uniref:alpha/beta hydrolase n=1 Tax=Aneurinibacillus aneurinilyticus TaxID=1391 RepID=UPI0023F26251|nr:alpha/beta hydrolase-fold protein [Aneurinibacillus aneurinilyticus]
MHHKVEIPHAEQWMVHSQAENRLYQIMVAQPAEDPPPSGYPVIYLLDANSVFGTMVEAVRLQSRRPEKSGVVPAIIVGIGYQTEEPYAPERFYDFTPIPTTEYHQKPDGTALPEQGGAAAFLNFIEEELKPHIERKFRIDSSRQTIFGHSLGGLFTLYALFTKPEAFQCYIAGSPSIHWNRQYLLEQERNFMAHVKKKSVNVQLLLGVGELEKTHISGNCDNAKELSARLSALSSQGMKVMFKQFEGEGHVSVLPTLISQAIRFALNPKK